MKVKLIISVLLLGMCLLAGCLPIPDCRDCGFTHGGRVRLGYPLPCDNCTMTVVADSQGCITYQQPDNGRCIDVSKTEISSFRLFSVSPGDVDLQSPPSSFTISGEAMSTAYGMPKVDFWDKNEVLQYQTTASSVSADGTTLQVSTPDLSQVYSGYYNIEVSNINPDGSTQIIGVATVQTYGRDEPDPWYCVHDGTCAEWDDVNCVCLRTE